MHRIGFGGLQWSWNASTDLQDLAAAATFRNYVIQYYPAMDARGIKSLERFWRTKLQS
jgi:hypothetical protein